MDSFQIFILLMAGAVILVGLAQRFRLPYPLALVLGGALVGFIPGINAIPFDPSLLLVIVLPPLLHFSAIWTSFREFNRNIRDIISLALGLVAFTTLIVGLLFKWLFPEVSWATAFAFGAIVSPPDAVSASTILKRFNLSPSLMAVLEGESLINDAVALVIYKFSIVAILTGSFSLEHASFEFVQITIGGIAVGLAFGYLVQQFVRFSLPPIIAVLFSFLPPYILFSLAMSLNVSGVLAVVTGGLVTSYFFMKHFEPFRRVLGVSTWGIFIILLNCFVFVLIGLQLKTITQSFTMSELYLYSGYAVLITLVMFVVRLMWVSAKHTFCYIRSCDTSIIDHLREGAIISWCGMRGIISLACAMALPISLSSRDVIIFITFVVIMLTLVIPSLTLPVLLKWLKVSSKKEVDTFAHIRKELVEAAEKEISTLLHLDDEERLFLKNYVTTRQKALEISLSKQLHHERLEEARRKILQTQRKRLLELWEKGVIDDVLLKHLEVELDLEEQLTIRAELH